MIKFKLALKPINTRRCLPPHNLYLFIDVIFNEQFEAHKREEIALDERARLEGIVRCRLGGEVRRQIAFCLETAQLLFKVVYGAIRLAGVLVSALYAVAFGLALDAYGRVRYGRLDRLVLLQVAEAAARRARRRRR